MNYVIILCHYNKLCKHDYISLALNNIMVNNLGLFCTKLGVCNKYYLFADEVRANYD